MKAKKKLHRLMSILLCCVLVLGLIPMTAFAAEPEYRIQIENGIHYLPDASASDGRIILFCMNNKSNWPHSIPGNISEEQVPSYIDGYLTPSDFSSEEEYQECMNRLSAILYAGYPYNALRLYQISSAGYIMTEADFNSMLVVPNALRTDFASSLGDTTFTYADYTGNNTTNLNKLHQFLVDLGELFPNGRTASGLSYSDITAMPFYKAAFCMEYADESHTPLQVFNAMYGGAYFVTAEQAYNATQNAVWKLLYSYGIQDNDLHDISATPLGETLLEISNTTTPLKVEPEESKVQIHAASDDYTLSYNPEDEMWYSDVFWISENENYNGEYVFTSLPAGTTVVTEHGGNYVHVGEKFSFISDHFPEMDETVVITSYQKWMGDLKQYSPAKDVTVNGKKFQHMAGALVYDKSLALNMTLTNDETSLEITKKVVGEADSDTAFSFQLKLTNRPIYGQYGDLYFNMGVAEFTLKDGETVTAKYLPQGSKYVVTEAASDTYTTTSTNESGTLGTGQSVQVEFINTKKGSTGGTTPTEPTNPAEPTKPTKPTGSNPSTGALDDVPQTGDNSMMWLWFILLFVSGTGLGGVVNYSKRRKAE